MAWLYLLALMAQVKGSSASLKISGDPGKPCLVDLKSWKVDDIIPLALTHAICL